MDFSVNKPHFSVFSLPFLCIILLSSFHVIAGDTDVDDGGWHTNPADRIADAGPCNIEVRNASISQLEFLDRYAHKRPVVIRGLTDNSEIRRKSRKDYILKKFGQKIIRLSSANTYSYQKVDVTLQKYVDDILHPQTLDTLGNETLIWFGDNNHKEWEDVFSSYNQPSLSLPGLTAAYSYGVAGPGTGVPFHFHGPGFAEVIYGRKRWFMYPPYLEPYFHPNKTTLHWLLEEYPKLTQHDMLLECTMGPGEVDLPLGASNLNRRAALFGFVGCILFKNARKGGVSYHNILAAFHRKLTFITPEVFKRKIETFQLFFLSQVVYAFHHILLMKV